jgi:type I restriction-modification system DNA methylase subunit
MPAPPVIADLVARFDQQADAYKSGQYNEAQLRNEFVDPMFKALGWDMENISGYAEAYKDVIHEDAIKIGGATKAPDYCFRIGGTRKFFLEAKKPSVDIKTDAHPAFQLRRYAWSAKLPLSVLTDFEEFAAYDCRVKPALSDNAATARVLYLQFPEYISRWDEIEKIFSREAILKGSFDKFAESTKAKRGTAEVDDAFLDEIEKWRADLAANLALRNPTLSQRDLNFAVQRTIDRIVFLRICEDRRIEVYGRLMALLNGEHTYTRLQRLFREADERYNSGLFHFQKEKDRVEPPDDLTPGLEIDDAVLKKIIRRLYYPESPYEFSVLPADILGQVYEQFLGKVIRLTEGHRAKVEDKPEVKKSGGVYYTPTYIVDYIVQNTVGKLLENKTPKQAAKLRILDPACGSGSFLIGAYQYLLDWHRDWFASHDPKKSATGRNPALYQAPGGEWKLTTTERKRILLQNIFGVDIDAQAVETTKLSLLLKVLEGESEQTLATQLRFYHERALPDLGSNIKCGNSLISSDFYDQQEMSFLDEEERYRINVFDWNAEFAEIMKAGGIDAVIGNPPWGAYFSQPELEYLRNNYRRVIARMIDSYIYFIDRATRLAKREGLIGFIVPSTILNQVDARPVRELLLRRGLTTLISLGQGIFGKHVLNTSTIQISGSRSQANQFTLANLSGLPLLERQAALNTVAAADWAKWQKSVERDPDLTFFVGDVNAIALLDRLRTRHAPLKAVVTGGIQRGVSPDVVTAHVVSNAEAKAAKIEGELLRPSISGPQIKRYRDWQVDQWIIYTTSNTAIEKFPYALARLQRFKHLNTCKEVIEGKHPWWALHRPRDPAIFDAPKFIGLTTSKTIEVIYDADASAYVTDAMFVFRIAADFDPWAAMAILQSKLFLFLYRVANQGESRVIPQIKAAKLEQLPFPVGRFVDRKIATLNERCKEMVQLHKQLAAAKTAHAKTNLQRQIDATDAQIDKLVYELYELTPDEIKIVEGAAR